MRGRAWDGEVVPEEGNLWVLLPATKVLSLRPSLLDSLRKRELVRFPTDDEQKAARAARKEEVETLFLGMGKS